ncbi:hypothetical protein ACAW74_06455 [Fibrella sp. WM1]|uniref:hypothetical protein n=1 Tax=Fibrella musci TaxID=3242485 RepID=UPI003520D57D
MALKLILQKNELVKDTLLSILAEIDQHNISSKKSTEIKVAIFKILSISEEIDESLISLIDD